MDKEKSSKTLNWLTGGLRNEYLCSRIHMQRTIYGGLWLPLGVTIDVMFFILRRQRQHVRATYLLQRRRDREASDQRPTGAQKEEKAPQQTHSS